ncbi:hypothetical protein NLJ89_g10044 [Agrocybe chaxingu]|uniref:CxC2-like cysteine cluster KDZ transposase-associated domain-containing protein n=1 Tax=Agrocybe chaxingu TaxID=84603 RepID=A0A9W8MR95_9AGAR|nr:hypothetical protein NLJ89_g10044 [Agrocybe chaxingu]
MAKRRKAGLSKTVTIDCGSSFAEDAARPDRPRGVPLVRHRVSLNKTRKQIEAEQTARNAKVAALSFEQREDLLAQQENTFLLSTSGNGGTGSDGYGDDDDINSSTAGFAALPPGEEGFFQSHKGGEATLHGFFLDTIAKTKQSDYRSRKDRVEKRVLAWREQMDDLSAAYVALQREGPRSLTDDDELWTLPVIALEGRGLRPFAHRARTKHVSVSLLEFGHIGASPTQPSLAFSVELLRFYRQLRRVCPRFSLDAFAKSLNHFHHVPHDPYLADQLSDTYDCYLEILRRVESQVSTALRREDAAWAVKNVCPPCLYKVIGEEPLKFQFLAAMDGNNSLKLVDSEFRAGNVRTDTRTTTSRRWIHPEEVNLFEHEVRKSSTPPSRSDQSQPADSHENQSGTALGTDAATAENVDNSDLSSEETAWLNVTEQDELAKCLNACVERWRNAGPEARKKMFALFAIAGIFISVCRHGHVLVICDMIRSGELMKYPLSVVNRLMDDFGSDICLGYDIMCAFTKTLAKSSIGKKTVAFRLHGVVPAFHGHAHNRGCQVRWHPTFVEGVGLEDFEECERTFCRSNELASVTRLATPYHRQQHVDEHFHFHDLDKHAGSGNFIYQKYRQALEKISIETPHLAALSIKRGLTGADYERFLESERKYLAELCEEPESVQDTADYMELLFDLDKLKQTSEDAARMWKKRDRLIIEQGYTGAQITKIDTRYRTTFQKWFAKNEQVLRYEEEHNIPIRWAPTSQEYEDGAKLVRERKYRRALDELERLVVQRLFEMTKLGQNGVGYKLREKISKSLKTRATAIQSALKVYNEAAGGLDPPRAPLTWESVMNAATIADFDLLRDARQDICTLDWAQPANREGMVLYFGLQRAKEEIRRLNIEIRRLLTFLYDDHVDHYRAIAENIILRPDLAHEISLRWEYRQRIHERIVKRLLLTSRLKGFTGSLFHGRREGRDPALNEGIPPPPWCYELLKITEVIVEYEEPADGAAEVTEDAGTDILVEMLEQGTLEDV